MSLTYAHGREFVAQVRPILERGDADGFRQFLWKTWPAERLREVLTCGHDDAVRIALAGLGFTGTMQDCPHIAGLLHDDDGQTAELAEHALWSIWFRAGGEMDERLAIAVRQISTGELDAALATITAVIGLRPDYAEAYHQLGLLYFLRGDYQRTILNCRSALLLNPWHFAAMSSLGHAYAAAGDLGMAYTAYQRALQLHPRLQGVRQALRQIRSVMPTPPVNSFTNL